MKIKHIAAAALLTVPTAQAFAAEVSGNVALTSDYRFRGISQSDNAPICRQVYPFPSPPTPRLTAFGCSGCVIAGEAGISSRGVASVWLKSCASTCD